MEDDYDRLAKALFINDNDADKYTILKLIINTCHDKHIFELIQEINENNENNKNGNIDDTYIQLYDRYKLLIKLNVEIDDKNKFLESQLKGFIDCKSFEYRIETLKIINHLIDNNDFEINDSNKSKIVANIIFNYNIWFFNYYKFDGIIDSKEANQLHYQLDLLFKNICH